MTMTAKQLSERETAVLAAILECMPHGGHGNDLMWRVRKRLHAVSPQDVTEAGVHRTAASLVRKDLAWRDGRQVRVYKITQTGREALRGNVTGQWIARVPRPRTLEDSIADERRMQGARDAAAFVRGSFTHFPSASGMDDQAARDNGITG
jgi:hypothetical protein